MVHLREVDRLLRVRLARHSPAGAHRLQSPVEQCRPTTDGGEQWSALSCDGLAALLDAELTLRSGHGNPEFAGQVTASRDALATILTRRPARPRRPVAGSAGHYLDSEQALLAGHPRHPAPKWRCATADWYRYAPEGRTAFPLRWLAVPAEHVREHALEPGFDVHARTAALLGEHLGRVPDDHRGLPVHPWQFRLVLDDPATGPVLRAALAAGTVRDLGEVGLPVHPTASVRTLYQPDVDVFLKTSLNVRITNCLRRNAAYELAGAVELTGLLAGPIARVAAHPGFAVLREPASRTVTLAGAEPAGLAEAFGVIVRAGLRDVVAGGEQVHLAGTLAAAVRDPAGTRTALADLLPAVADPVAGCCAGGSHTWRCSSRRSSRLLRPRRRAGAASAERAGRVDPDGCPPASSCATWRAPSSSPGAPTSPRCRPVARAVRTTEARGWNRVAYCLLVNHLSTCSPRSPICSRPLRRGRGGAVVHGPRASGTRTSTAAPPGALRALLAGDPLPAKANLLTRWERTPTGAAATCRSRTRWGVMRRGDPQRYVRAASRPRRARACPVATTPYLLDVRPRGARRRRSARCAARGSSCTTPPRPTRTPEILAALAPYVDGYEVRRAASSPTSHRRPGRPLAFGGPGKTDAEIAAALTYGVDRFHVESLHELRMLDLALRGPRRAPSGTAALQPPAGRPAGGSALAMGGRPTPVRPRPRPGGRACASGRRPTRHLDSAAPRPPGQRTRRPSRARRRRPS